MYKPEDQAFLAEARVKIASGCSKEEEKTLLTKVVAILREGRMGAVQAAKKSRSAKKLIWKPYRPKRPAHQVLIWLTSPTRLLSWLLAITAK